jgi:hypothetical protein
VVERSRNVDDVRVVASGLEIAQSHRDVSVTNLPNERRDQMWIRLALADYIEDARDDGRRPG